jgi:molybdate transport system ATP-binding protein
VNHIGIYLSNSVNKDWIIEEIFLNKFLREYLDLSGLHGELFSTLTIHQMIDEELRHERFLVFTEENPDLLSMSSGQQRKALLTYALSQKPQYIVLDDLFGSIDKETQQYIIEKLKQVASSTLFIQLFYRKQDVLDWTQTVYMIDGENKIVAQYPLEKFISLQEITHPIQEITHPIQEITLPHLFSETSDAINPVVQLNSVSASYGGKQVLKDICWTIHPGEFWQLKGPVGSGKSTLLSMIIGDNPRGYGQDMILFGRKKGSGETIWDIRKQIG